MWHQSTHHVKVEVGEPKSVARWFYLSCRRFHRIEKAQARKIVTDNEFFKGPRLKSRRRWTVTYKGELLRIKSPDTHIVVSWRTFFSSSHCFPARGSKSTNFSRIASSMESLGCLAYKNSNKVLFFRFCKLIRKHQTSVIVHRHLTLTSLINPARLMPQIRWEGAGEREIQIIRRH